MLRFELLFTFFVSCCLILPVTIYSNDLALARRYRISHQYDKAIEILKSPALAGNTEAELLLAKIYLDQNKSEEATGIYTKLCGSINSHDCWNEMGIVYLAAEKYEKAQDCFLRAVSVREKSAGTYSNLAVAYFAQNKRKEAATFYKKAMEMARYNPIYQVNYGVFLIGIKKYTQAKFLLQKVVLQNEGMFFAELYLGVAHYHKKEYSSALLHINKGVEINPTYYDLYFYRALVYYKTGDYVNALNDLNTVDELFPENRKTSKLRRIIKRNL